MFLCKNCLDKCNFDGEWLLKWRLVSIGKCEDCNKINRCVDIYHSELPLPHRLWEYSNINKEERI